MANQSGKKQLWSNQPYQDLSSTLNRLDEEDIVDIILPADQAPVKSRHAVEMPAAEITQWYDVLSSCSQDIWTHYAIDVTDIVTAETAQLKLVQTLTKTFAEMPVGLAIFDQQRRLVLFNPALTDLTSLAFEFLFERPSLFEFFNRLWENRVVPEPKNSAAWRAQLAE